MPPAAANERVGCDLGPLHTVPRTAFPRPRQGTSPPAPPYVRAYGGHPGRRTASPCTPCSSLTHLARNQDNNTVLLRAVDISANRWRFFRHYDVIRRRQGGISHSVPLPALDGR